MKKKMILTFIAMILLPVLVIVCSVFRGTKKVAVNNMNETTLQTLEQAGKDIRGFLSSVEFASDTLFRDALIKEYIGDKTENDFTGMLDNISKLRDSFYNYETALNLYRIELYIDDAKMAAREYVHFFPMSAAESAGWYEEMLGQGGAGMWSGVYRDEIILESGAIWLLSYRRTVRAGSNIFSNDGVLAMDITETQLNSYIREIPNRSTEQVFLVDGEGRLLSAQDKTQLGEPGFSEEIRAQLLAADSGILKADWQGRHVTLVYTVIPGMDWKLVDLIDTECVLENYSYWNDVKLVMIVMVVILLFVAASFVVIHTFDKELVRRITRMAEHLEQGTLPQVTEAEPATEIDRAEQLVYGMIEKNARLTEENYRAHLEERKIQLFALQAQINPHFLYNTLECINWMAFRRGATEISTTVTMLAKYFRLSLNKGREVVSIAEEVELARTYLNIQNIRFDSALETEIQVAESMQKYAIPKLVLQPFVENAVLHGILKKPARSGKISIETVEEERLIRIIVTDDGMGVDRKVIDEVLSREQKNHYGIYNANMRMKLFFGDAEEYGTAIDSVEGVGTKVTLTVGKVPVEKINRSE